MEGTVKNIEIEISIAKFYEYLCFAEMGTIMRWLISEQDKVEWGRQQEYSGLKKAVEVILDLHLNGNTGDGGSLHEFIGIHRDLKLEKMEIDTENDSITLTFSSTAETVLMYHFYHNLKAIDEYNKRTKTK